MKRRTILAGIGSTAVLGLAGCVEDAHENSSNTDTAQGSAGDTVTDHFEEPPDRPECEKESETVEADHGDETYQTPATIPYPSEPETFDEGGFITFIEEFDRAFVRHDILCQERTGYILNVGHSIQKTETYDWEEGITHIFLLRAAGASAGLDEEGAKWQADLGFSGVVYAIDESGLARQEFDDAAGLEPDEIEGKSPDPLEDGLLVAKFE